MLTEALTAYVAADITAESLGTRAQAIVSIGISVLLFVITFIALWRNGRQGDSSGALSIVGATMIALIPAAISLYVGWKMVGSSVLDLIMPGWGGK